MFKSAGLDLHSVQFKTMTNWVFIDGAVNPKNGTEDRHSYATFYI